MLDGAECWRGAATPTTPLIRREAPGATNDPDKDGLPNYVETGMRTQSFSNQVNPPTALNTGNEDVDNDQGGAAGACNLGVAPDYAGTCGQTDVDSDGDGLSDGCEIFITGTNPLRPDSDCNGTPDASETRPAAAAAAHCGSPTDLDGDTVLNDVDNCTFVSNAAQTNVNATIGNGKGIAGDDATVPWNVKNDLKGDACDGDWDNDSIKNGVDANSGRPLDITYDDSADGTWKGAGDTGTSWDSDMNAKLDGVQTLCPVAGPWGTSDRDGDGLLNSWEFCKWASSPNYTDSDGDTKGDCVEAADVDGNGVVSFTGDVIYYAKAILLSPATFGQDGDFDIDGNNTLSFTGDVIQEAKFGLLPGLCK